MIIGRPDIFDATAFALGLARAVRGVLRVGVDSRPSTGAKEISSRASAWLITDDLAVLCDYVLAREFTTEPKYYCFFPTEDGESQPVPAEPVFGGIPELPSLH